MYKSESERLFMQEKGRNQHSRMQYKAASLTYLRSHESLELATHVCDGGGEVVDGRHRLHVHRSRLGVQRVEDAALLERNGYT